MSKEDLQAKRALLEAMTNDELREPTTIPVDIYIREAEKLHNICKDDLEKLKVIGFNEEVLNDLPVCIGALREAESLWLAFRHSREEARMLWEKHSVEGYRLRDRLIAAFRFAYRGNDVLTGRVRAIASGRGHADMVQDINDLAVLGRTNPEPLKLLNFDFTRLEQAAKMADFLGDILGRFDADIEYHRAKRLRDAAYTHLREAVNEIREYGKYLHHEERERRQRYTSDFLRRRRRQMLKRTREKQEQDKSKGPVVVLPVKTIN